MTRTRLITFLLAGLAGCATASKPQELVDLELMRKGNEYGQAKEKQPALVKESDEAHGQAVSAWEEEKLDESKHWATLGTIKLRTAQALLSQEAARQRVTDGQKRLAELEGQHRDTLAKIKEADEQLRLHGELSAARKAALEKEAQLQAKLTEAQKNEEAQKKVSDAQLALRLADTVEASKHAQGDYAGAQSLLARAEAALKAGQYTDAGTTADMAKAKADAACAAARPQFLAAKQVAQRQAQNQALQKDAAAIPGVTVKLKTVGQTQQLIIPVLDLFRGVKSTPRPERVGALNEIGALLKKYSEYPVLIQGYTSSRVGRSQQYAVSQARAQQVASHFVAQGVAFSRMAVSGLGAENPVAKPYQTLNDRVEVILLFQ